MKQISDNEIYLLIKYEYIKSVLWRVAKRLSYIEDARGLKVKHTYLNPPRYAGSCILHCISYFRLTIRSSELILYLRALDTNFHNLLVPLAKSRNANINLATSICLSIRPSFRLSEHSAWTGTVPLPLDGISLHLTFEHFFHKSVEKVYVP